MKIINETEQYFANLIHELGLKLNSVATCSKIRCTKFGPFTLQHALLRKHFGIESVLNNMQDTARILHDFDMNVRDPLLRVSTVPEDEDGDCYRNEDESPRRSEEEQTTDFSR